MEHHSVQSTGLCGATFTACRSITKTAERSRVTGTDRRSVAVELESVSKRFGSALAVDVVSLAVPGGAITTLLGPSGCGKSTTLRLIGGFERPDAGIIRIGGVDMTCQPPHRRDTALMFQSYALFPHLSVAENVGFGLRERGIRHREATSRIGEMLALVDLEMHRDARPSQLSGGQQQRVALARALATRPTVVLLDEPLGALDAALRRHMQGELRRIQHETGITFISVTHDQQEALSISDRIVVMNEGRIIQQGTPVEVFEQPANRFVAGFMGARNILDAPVRSQADRRAEVSLAGRVFSMALPEGCDAPATASIVIRPARISLQPITDPIPDLPSWPGLVTDLVYAGGSQTVTVTIANGIPLIVEQPLSPDRATRPVATGDRVLVSFDPRHATVLPGSSSS